MNTRSKSTLFLIEQLIVIAVFAICAAACISMLAYSYFTAEDTRDLSSALLVAESGAEAFKATGGDLSAVASVMGGTGGSEVSADELAVYYDSLWRPYTPNADDEPTYKLLITARDTEDAIYPLRSGQLTVLKLTGTDDCIVSFPVVARAEVRS